MPKTRQAKKTTPAVPAFVPPYAPSWIDRLTDLVDRLPGPAWLAYLVLGAAGAVIQIALQWSSGVYRPGPLLLLHISMFASPAYLLAMVHYIDRSAASALEIFRPVLQLSSPEEQTERDHTTYAELRYRLTTLPARATAWVAILGCVGLTLFVFPLFGVPGGGPPSLARNLAYFRLSMAPVPAAAVLLETFLYMAMFGTLVYHTLHQLRLIEHVLANHTRRSPYRMQPLYAFSVPVALTAGGFLVLTYALFATGGAFVTESPASVALYVCLDGFAVVAFVFPFWSIHRQLVQEKRRLLEESSEWFERTVADLHQRLGRPRLTGMDELNKALASLELEQAALRRIPTWPWEPGTLRGLIVTLLLPIIIWLIQYILQRLLG